MELQDLLLHEGIVPSHVLAAAGETAVREGRPLAAVLVEDHGVADDVFADVVARHLGAVVMDVELGALDTDSVRLIPEDVARRHLLIPVARGPGGASLRVAFANPFDEDAVAAVRRHCRLEVDPMVATVSGVRAAIEREYRGASTRVIRAGRPDRPRETPPEDTHPVALPESSDTLPPTGTAPLHRLEADATIEQRHEALLLALVEGGMLTRSDYVAALQRLMGKR